MRTKYSIKNSITALISSIITIIFLFISQTLFIKILGVEYSGLNGLFSNILTVLNFFKALSLMNKGSREYLYDIGYN